VKIKVAFRDQGNRKSLHLQLSDYEL